MSNIARTASNTATALLGTISTTANVLNAGLNSANIAALDLQERTQQWATNARTERKLSQGTAIKQAKINYAKDQATQAEELTTWLAQNTNRTQAFTAALAEADALLA